MFEIIKQLLSQIDYYLCPVVDTLFELESLDDALNKLEDDDLH